MAEETRGALQRTTQKGVIPVTWDAEKNQFTIALRGFVIKKTYDSATGVDIYFKPPVLYDVRVRKVGALDWGPGFRSPYSTTTFVGLEPDTDYEVQVTPVDESGNPVPDSPTLRYEFHTVENRC